jgi:hypothetical protein
VLVVKQPSLSPERELNRFGIGQDFVIPDHAAVARQDIRGKVRVDLIRIGVLRQVPFGTEIKAPELALVRFADLVRDGLRHGD